MEANKERYVACMLLHAVGDAMGYKNGRWEFKFSTQDIHEELKELGGISALQLNPKHWKVSDDTILHLANAEYLLKVKENETSKDETYLNLVDYYKKAMRDMLDRAPGNTTMNSVAQLSSRPPFGYRIPFNKRGGGCGASMRSPCIGLRFPREEQKRQLIEFAVESGRMTHHNPIGYLGGVAGALFTSYAFQKIDLNNWGVQCLEDFKLAEEYIKNSQHCPMENLASWKDFTQQWSRYLANRNIDKLNQSVLFPKKYDVNERDEFYKSIANNKWPGSNGLDSVLIAYDALLGCQGSWEELCMRGVLHGGDNDSTGCLAAAWFGALYGLSSIPEVNYRNLEYKQRIMECADEMFNLFSS